MHFFGLPLPPLMAFLSSAFPVCWGTAGDRGVVSSFGAVVELLRAFIFKSPAF